MHYHSYLKHISATAQKQLTLEPANFDINENTHQVFNESANILIKRIAGDVLYLDPPYTDRNYGSSYHLLNTLARYDNFVPSGKTGLREYQKSAWCRKRLVASELDDLMMQVQFQYIFLSYNNEGLLSPQNIENIMSRYGRYDYVSTDYRRFKSCSGIHQANKTTEYIHILEK